MKTSNVLINKIGRNERVCYLASALESPLMQNPLYLWVVPGQFLENTDIWNSYETITYVAKSFAKPDHYSICTIVDGKRIFMNKDFSKAEIKQLFPNLFKVTGQLISL